MLQIKNLTKSLHGKNILDNISFSVHSGQIACLLGNSGCGKTTLLRTICNLEQPESGECMINGKSLSKEQYAKPIVGMVFQHYNLFEHLTVEKNITLVLENVMQMSTLDAQKKAHVILKDYSLDSHAKKTSCHLSGGQKQRLAIARTIALKPKVICFDEPTASLDPVLKNQTAEIIQNLARQGHIIIIATHDMSLLNNLKCTIHLLANGSIKSTISSAQYADNSALCKIINNFVSGNNS